MSAYHVPESTGFGNLSTVTAVEEFLAHNEEHPRSFEIYEIELAALMRAVECELKAAELARYDVDSDAIVVDGTEYRRCLTAEPRTYSSSSGSLSVRRNLFRSRRGGKAICPMEFRAGIVFGCTPVLARQVLFLMGHMTSDETAVAFDEMGVAGPSASTCDRLPKKAFGKVWEQHREEWEGELRSMETVPSDALVLACSLDGVMVPDKDGQRAAKCARDDAKKRGIRKQACGPAGYREVGCGTVTLYAPPQDPASKVPEQRSPHRLETIRYGRAPEYKKKTLTEQLNAEVQAILGPRPNLTLVALADGAEENWRYFDGPMWEHACKIVDHGHACQHLKDAMAASHDDKIEGRAEYEKFRLILRDKPGGIQQVIAELDRLDRRLRRNNHPRRRKRLAKERTYFRNQRDRMDYARYQELGLPIGSGVVEAACKTLATQRLKRSGMSWGRGMQSILTIRSLQQSGRWKNGWALLAASFRRDVSRVTQHGQLRSISLLQDAA